VLSLLTACTGDRAAADFEAAFVDDPAVVSIELTSHDNQPFTGGVSGEVLAAAGLPDDEFSALVDRLSGYTAAHADSMRGQVTVVGEDVSLPVTGVAADDASNARLLLSLRTQPGFLSAALTLDHRAHVAARVVTADDALALAQRVPSLAEDAGIAAAPGARVRTADDMTDLSALSTAQLAEAAAVWAAVTREVPAVGIRADGTAITIALSQESDLARAAAAAASVRDTSQIRFASDLVRLGDADGALARALWDELGIDARETVDYVWESNAVLQVATIDAGSLPGAVTPVAAAAAEAGAPSVQLRAQEPKEVSVDLTSAADLDALPLALAELIEDAAVTSLTARQDSVRVTVTGMSDTQVGRLAVPLKAIASPDARVCVERERDAICVTAADALDPATARAAARPFVDAWNDAPVGP
jgi:hypothetical protein